MAQDRDRPRGSEYLDAPAASTRRPVRPRSAVGSIVVIVGIRTGVVGDTVGIGVAGRGGAGADPATSASAAGLGQQLLHAVCRIGHGVTTKASVGVNRTPVPAPTLVRSTPWRFQRRRAPA